MKSYKMIYISVENLGRFQEEEECYATIATTLQKQNNEQTIKKQQQSFVNWNSWNPIYIYLFPLFRLTYPIAK